MCLIRHHHPLLCYTLFMVSTFLSLRVTIFAHT